MKPGSGIKTGPFDGNTLIKRSSQRKDCTVKNEVITEANKRNSIIRSKNANKSLDDNEMNKKKNLEAKSRNKDCNFKTRWPYDNMEFNEISKDIQILLSKDKEINLQNNIAAKNISLQAQEKFSKQKLKVDWSDFAKLHDKLRGLVSQRYKQKQNNMKAIHQAFLKKQMEEK